MKLYSIYTDETKILKDEWFLKTIQDDWELNIVYWGKIGEGDGKWNSPGFKYLIRKRIEYLVNVIKDNWGDVIIWSDIDIQFFGRCTNIINKSMQNKDIVFLSDYRPTKKVNGGFIAIRCNAKTLLLFESVLKTNLEELPYHDQSAINNILRENLIDIKWGLFPRQIWALSNPGELPVDIVLHHAICAPTVESKIKQLEEIRKLVMFRKKLRWFYAPKYHIKELITVIKRRLKIVIRKYFQLDCRH